MTRPAETIDQVIGKLTEIVDWSRAEGSCLGYFPALYRKVTVKVKEGIESGFFDDGPRMERLDVLFANRYLDALAWHRAGEPTTLSWSYAFQVARQWWPIVLQHLLLGINAHINLDLGVACARVIPPAELGDLRSDFDRINAILGGLVAEVKEDLARIWSTLRLFNRYLGNVETAIINFSLERARDHAWSVATRLSPLDESEQQEAIDEFDRETATLGRLIRHPGFVASSVNRLIRVGERGSIARKIAILSD